MPTKRCGSCTQVKGLTEFHRRAASPDGRQHACKVCMIADRRSRYNKGGRYDRGRRYVPCPECGEDKTPAAALCLACYQARRSGPVNEGTLVTTDEDAAWLAGLLEGEGCFHAPPGAVLSVNMADKDVILRVAALLGHPRRVRTVPPQQEHHSTLYLTQTSRRAVLEHVIGRIGPWLGERRRRQAALLHGGVFGDAVLPDTRCAVTDLSLPQLSWVAGLLEGEGTFLAPPPSSPNQPRLRVQMTDRDIVDRFAGCGA